MATTNKLTTIVSTTVTDRERHLIAHSAIAIFVRVLDVRRFIAPFFRVRKKIPHKLRVVRI